MLELVEKALFGFIVCGGIALVVMLFKNQKKPQTVEVPRNPSTR